MAGKRGTAQLLCRQNNCVEGSLDFVRNRVVEYFVNVAQKFAFIYLDFLRCLLNRHNLGIALLESARLGLDLEVSILVAQLYPLILLAVLY